MKPKDKRTKRPTDRDEPAAPRAADAAPPARDEDEEAPATKPETPMAKFIVGAKLQPPESGVAAPPAPDAAPASTWSPPDYPSLVFSWSVVLTNDPAVLRFPTQVNLYTTAMQPVIPVADPQSLLVDATLSSDRTQVVFSVSDGSGVSPFLRGTLCYEPGPTTASLTVTSLKYPGGSISRQVLYP